MKSYLEDYLESIYENEDKIPKYNVNQYFRSSEEIESLDIDYETILIAKDILRNPDAYTEEEIDLVLNGVFYIANNLNKICEIINTSETNYLLDTEHLIDMLMLGENRLQKLDDVTLKFALNAIVGATIDLVDSLLFGLETLASIKAESKTKPKIESKTKTKTKTKN
ncbi:hypothetical phage protein [Campylobacter phage CP220]|uniref:Hypothetical phage protein n=1 Tax=Campylobacter phage CP220 TaxID=2994044 RepID=D5GV57_9CAUD|nr:hypothetical protein APL47_gp065 [Campylobacter phage CP220]CBJ93874.1 hypothetical phage protein [Campylobacter phage CP220]